MAKLARTPPALTKKLIHTPPEKAPARFGRRRDGGPNPMVGLSNFARLFSFGFCLLQKRGAPGKAVRQEGREVLIRSAMRVDFRLRYLAKPLL
jgi:hypothetical protein